MKKGNETMEKAQQPTSILGELRNNRRDKHREHQDFSRLKAFEASRFVEAELVTEKDIAGLCSRIKRKKRASAEDLIKLSNAFIQSEKNITAFVKTTGAINIIVKEFTGNDKHQQILAAQLLCNLSLGDESSCSKIASFVGSYLMIMIMSSDFCLSRVCLWIAQNLVAASGSKALTTLLSQELLKNCLHILDDSLHHQAEALELLDIVLADTSNELSNEELSCAYQSVLQIMKKAPRIPHVLQVFYRIILRHPCETDEELLLLMINNLVKHEDDGDHSYFSVAILVLLLERNQNLIDVTLELFLKTNLNLIELLNRALENPKDYGLAKKLLKLLSLLYFHPSGPFMFPLEPLKIPKFFELSI